ncbi:MAG: hypothetical protein AB7L92_04905 [Alphaproteobacteria bacterium]
MASNQPNIAEARKKAADFLSRKLVDVRGIDKSQYDDDITGMNVIPLKNTAESIRAHQAAMAEDDFITASQDTEGEDVPDTDSYTIKDYLWSKLFDSFMLPVNRPEGWQALKKMPENERKEIITAAMRPRKAMDARTRMTVAMHKRQLDGYVEMLTALDQLAQGKELNDTMRSGLHVGLGELQHLLGQSRAQFGHGLARATDAGELERNHASTRSNEIMLALHSRDEAAIPDYVTQELRDRYRSLDQQYENGQISLDQLSDLTNVIRHEIKALILDHEPPGKDEYARSAASLGSQPTTEDALLTHAIAEIKAINRALGLGSDRERSG